MMSDYINFTDEQIETANATDLELFLLSRGERLLPSGREKRMESDRSITVRGNKWYDHACERGGYPIDFVMQHYGLSFQDAVCVLLGGNYTLSAEKENTHSERKAFALPKANADMRRVFAYLVKQRCIAQNVVAEFAHAKLLYEDAKHNAVFVGKDEHGIAKHAHLRSTNSFAAPFRLNIEGGDSVYSFHHDGTNDRLFVFEAPIDMLSYISLTDGDWKENSYVALCGTTKHAMLKMLELHPAIREVTLCMDNDEAGIKATERLRHECEERGIAVSVDLPQHKDWNDDLCAEVEATMKII